MHLNRWRRAAAALAGAGLPMLAAAADAAREASTPTPAGEVIDHLPPWDVLERNADVLAYVGPYYVVEPLHRVVLVRSGQARCAIRFTSSSRDHDEKPPTAFASGAETMRASAEFWTPGLAAPQPLQLTRSGTVGLARMIVVAPYHDTFRCGRALLRWMYPTGVLLEDDDHATQIAWTPLDDFAKVDFDDPALPWGGVDMHRPLRAVKLP